MTFPTGAGPYGARFAGEPWTGQQLATTGDAVGTPSAPIPSVIGEVSYADAKTYKLSEWQAPAGGNGWWVSRITLVASEQAYDVQTIVLVLPTPLDPDTLQFPEATWTVASTYQSADETEPLRPYYVPAGSYLSIYTNHVGRPAYARAVRVEYFEG